MLGVLVRGQLRSLPPWSPQASWSDRQTPGCGWEGMPRAWGRVGAHPQAQARGGVARKGGKGPVFPEERVAYVKSRVGRLAHGACKFCRGVVLGAEGALGRVQGGAGEAGGEVTDHWVLVWALCPPLRTVRSAEGGCPWLTPGRAARWLPWARSHPKFSFHRCSRTCEEADRCSRVTCALNTELCVQPGGYGWGGHGNR